jgi:alginate O-acetyltransferase complex protein AlgI
MAWSERVSGDVDGAADPTATGFSVSWLRYPRPAVLFPTVEFAIFFTVVLALSWALMPKQGVWKPFIIAASYAFYAAANWRFCLLLAGVTLGNQAAAKLMDRTVDEKARRWIVATAVALNLAVLGVFKYYAFFVQDVDRVLDAVRLGLPLPLLTIALPVGVSFFTFQAISYTVDVYRRLIPPASTVDVAVYLSFFPHLVAGPIVRAREFLPQLAKPRDPRNVAVGTGITLVAIGLIKKVALADYLARTVVDPVFAVPQAYAGPDVLLASYSYAAQIYCDFSGYTDIAIGLALLMGYVFPPNFRSPYRATGFRDFWRRWHMTLSRFLRDFLYIPLGGNRGGRLKTARNLMITMGLGGLWHGAAWTFVLWGGFHGTGLVAEHAIGGRVRVPGWLRWLVTFHLIVFGWILFRSQNLGDVGTILSRLVTPGAATLWTAPVVAVVAVVIGLQLLPERPLESLRTKFEGLSPVALGAGLATIIAFVGATVPSQGVPPFIYFRF